MSVAVELRDIRRHFGDVRAVDGVSLAIDDGEFFAMLGPSGSGKTTCLRLIGGFELPTAGRIFLHGEDAGRRAGCAPPGGRARRCASRRTGRAATAGRRARAPAVRG
jgi:ABC-type Fe3+/spermidine/putrescine transport system ATPase subunit